MITAKSSTLFHSKSTAHSNDTIHKISLLLTKRFIKFCRFHNMLKILNRLTIIFGQNRTYEQFCCGMYTCKGTFVQLKHKHFKRSSAESTPSTFKKCLRILVTSTEALVDPFLVLVIVASKLVGIFLYD